MEVNMLSLIWSHQELENILKIFPRIFWRFLFLGIIKMNSLRPTLRLFGEFFQNFFPTFILHLRLNLVLKSFESC